MFPNPFVFGRKAVLATAISVLLVRAPAAVLTWDILPGDGGSITDGLGNWSDLGGNWNNAGDATWNNATPDSAVFGAGGVAGVVTLTTAITAAGLTFESVGGNYTIMGNTLTLAGTPSITVNDDLAVISSILAGAAATPVVKRGTGTLVLSGNNTFAGALSIEAGTVSVATVNNDNTAGVLGNSANAVVLGGAGAAGTLQLTAVSGTINTNKKFTLATGGSGVFQVDAAAAVLQLNGVISGGGGLTKTGAGTLTLANGSPTYTGPTLVSAGTLAYNTSNVLGSGPVTVNGATAVLNLNGASDTVGTVTLESGSILSGNLTSTGSFELKSGTVTSNLSGTGIVLNKTTGGTVTMSAGSSYTGLTSISDGTLALGNSNVLPDASAIVINGLTAVLDMGLNHNDTVGTVTLDGGATILATGSSALRTDTPNSFELKSGTIFAGLDGTGALNKTTSGTVTLNRTGTISGVTTVSAGTLAYGANDVLGNGNVIVNGATAVLDLGADHTDSIGNLTLDGGGSILGTVTSSLSPSGTIDLRSGLVTARPIGGAPLTKTTTGTVTLTGANTYSNSTTVSLGTLKLDFSASGAPASDIINNTINSSTLILGGGTLSITGAPGATNTQRFNGLTLVMDTSSAFRVTQNGATSVGVTVNNIVRPARSTIDFTLPTAGNIVSTTTASSGPATGNIMTDNAISYATVDGTDWATNISGVIGRLLAYATDNFATATNNVDVTTDVAPAQFTVHTLRFNTAGRTLTLASGGAATSSTVSAGGILVTAATAGAGNGVTITGDVNARLRSAGGKELVIVNYGQLTVNVPILENGGTAITIAGSGITIFNGADTNTGVTAVTGGLLRITTTTGLGSTGGATIVGSGGTLELATTGTISNEQLTLNGAGFNGMGALFASASSTWTGASTMNNATINVAGGVTWTRNSNNINVTGILTKIGAGTFALASANGAEVGTGSMLINDGTVSIDGGSNWNGGNITVATGGTLKIFGPGSNSVGDSRTITVRTGGTFDYQQINSENMGVVFLNGTGLNGEGALVNNAAVTTGILSGGLTLQSDSSIGVTVAAGGLTIGGLLSGSANLTKVGPGTLTFNSNAGTLTGNIFVNVGTLVANSMGPSNGATGALGRSNLDTRTITVAPAGTLRFSSNDVFGQVNTYLPPAIVVNGGVVTSTRYNAIGNITLNDGATLSQSATDTGGFQGYQFRGTINVGGTLPSTISTGNAKGNHLAVNTTFTVANVTGDSGVDLTVSAPLINQSQNFTNAAGGLTKAGPGTMALTGANTYTGPTTVLQGRLQVSGSLSGTSQVRVATGATLGGTGSVGNIVANTSLTDAGEISPGGSAGILTAFSVAGGTGLDFSFEMTQAGSPAFGSATASGIDVLHLTAATPFAAGSLDASNTVSVYFDHLFDTYRGGFYAFDGQANAVNLLETAVGNASFLYYVRDGAGGVIFNGETYSVVAAGLVTRTAFAETGTFGTGTVNGALLQFVVPEPGVASVLLAGFGLFGMGRFGRRR